MKIPVYQAEKVAGLEQRILSSCSVTCAAKAQLFEPFRVSRLPTAKASATDFDLHYLKTVLVTTGWNINDDVFDPSEVWNARATPEDKPFNYMHDCSDIIGHITGTQVVDDDEKEVTGDSLPTKFHVVTEAVLYKYWEKAELQERMERIIAEIGDGKWFVSMECLFKNFDYGVSAADGTQKVIARNDQTAFLTKHLRAYGGDGTYQGQKVGRVLRNFVFSGKGLVDKPANPESVILTAKASVMEQVASCFGCVPAVSHHPASASKYGLLGDVAAFFGVEVSR